VLTEFVHNHAADLVVVGTSSRAGLGKVLLGSIAEEIIRDAPCPVLTVGPAALPAPQIRKVLFATDFGPASEHALPYAMDFANRQGGELTLLHLVSPMPVEYVGPAWYPGTDVVEREEAGKRKALQQLRNLLPSDSGLKCKAEHLVEFHFAPEGILNAARAREVDLIVMGVKRSGTNASRLASHMPWAIAYEVVCQAACPVLTIRA